MIGMFSKRDNVTRLDRINERIARLERKHDLSDCEQMELEEDRQAAHELLQWLDDMHRMEG